MFSRETGGQVAQLMPAWSLWAQKPGCECHQLPFSSQGALKLQCNHAHISARAFNSFPAHLRGFWNCIFLPRG